MRMSKNRESFAKEMEAKGQKYNLI